MNWIKGITKLFYILMKMMEEEKPYKLSGNI